MRTLTLKYLKVAKTQAVLNGHPVQKWVQFCEAMLKAKWTVKLHRAKTTYSKYIYIKKGAKEFKIRFSNHPAAYTKEQENDSDYYVGIGHKGILTTEELIKILSKE